MLVTLETSGIRRRTAARHAGFGKLIRAWEGSDGRKKRVTDRRWRSVLDESLVDIVRIQVGLIPHYPKQLVRDVLCLCLARQAKRRA